MKTKIGERENKAKIGGVKGFLKAYPGAAVLAALIVAGGIGMGAMSLGNGDEVVLENEPTIEQEVEAPKEEAPAADEKKEEEQKEENKESEEESKEDETEEKKEDEKEETPSEEQKEETPATTPSNPAENTPSTGTPSTEGTTANNTTDATATTTTPDGQTGTAQGTTTTTTTATDANAAAGKKEETTATSTESKKEDDKKTEDVKASSSSLSAQAKKYKNDVNSDVVGWIQVPNTNINYPVVQAKDNNYYAARDINKNSSKNGVIYADYECNLKNGVGSTNTILYGHNWTNCWNPIRKNNANDVMFAQLHAFHYLDVAQSTPFIYFSTTSKDYVWQVFSVFYPKATWTDYIYAEPKSSVVKTALSSSLHDFNVSVSSSDKILTLSTCTRMLGNHNNQRFVVMAKLVPAGTAATNITSK